MTSYSNSAAQAMGHDKVQPSEERYRAAHESMDLVYQLWEKSWEVLSNGKQNLRWPMIQAKSIRLTLMGSSIGKFKVFSRYPGTLD